MEGLVLLSGGQDSATCLAWAKNEFSAVHTISFDYGQRHRIELEFSRKLADLAGAKSHTQLVVPTFTQIGDSALVGEGDISATHRSGDGLPASFVPGRNYIFLGLAAAQAFLLGVRDLVAGVCQTDYSGYPDCRDESIRAVQEALSLCLDRNIRIHTPLMFMTKSETVLWMSELGSIAWYGSTQTCYMGERPPCLECPACKLRQKGFEEARIKDPLLEL
jgi:7-cyano-7-deazaguanine synthase